MGFQTDIAKTIDFEETNSKHNYQRIQPNVELERVNSLSSKKPFHEIGYINFMS